MKCMKSEVYSWRLSASLKSDLEREARQRKMSMAQILDLAARELLTKSESQIEDAVQQERLQKAVAQCIGTFEGSDPHRSENVRNDVRMRLRQRNGR